MPITMDFSSILGEPPADSGERRILEFLYQCFKNKEAPDLNLLCAEHFSIDERLWPSVVMKLKDKGYITGVADIRNDQRNFPNGYVQFGPEVTITYTGIQYLGGTV